MNNADHYFKKNLVWKGVCQSYGDRGKMYQNWGAQTAGGYTVQKEDHGESGCRCVQCFSIVCSTPLCCCSLHSPALGGTKINLLGNSL